MADMATAQGMALARRLAIVAFCRRAKHHAERGIREGVTIVVSTPSTCEVEAMAVEIDTALGLAPTSELAVAGGEQE